MNPVHRAIERVGEYFAERQTRQGLVARRLLGISRPDDLKLSHHLLRERRAGQLADGGVGGDLVNTAWCLWEILEISEFGLAPAGAGLAVSASAIQKKVKWLLGGQDKDGAYGVVPPSKRKKRSKAAGTDQIIGGFFAYRGSGRTIRKLTLPTAVTVLSDQGCRFLASCFALRSALRAGRENETLVRRHIGSLLHIPKLWDTWGGQWNPALMLGALAAIAWSSLPFRAQLPILAEHVALNQKPDGSWRKLDIVHAVDALVAVPLPQARESVALAAPKLAKLQLQNGAIGTGTYAEERTLVALRAWLIAREYA